MVIHWWIFFARFYKQNAVAPHIPIRDSFFVFCIPLKNMHVFWERKVKATVLGLQAQSYCNASHLLRNRKLNEENLSEANTNPKRDSSHSSSFAFVEYIHLFVNLTQIKIYSRRNWRLKIINIYLKKKHTYIIKYTAYCAYLRDGVSASFVQIK